MEELKVKATQKISFDFSRFRLPQYVAEFKPLLYREGDQYCALFGPDIEAGIFGCGNTPEDALIDWNDHLREKLRSPDFNDPVIQYITDMISIINRNVY